jgi:lactate racemase
MTISLDYGRAQLLANIPDANLKHTLGLSPEPPLIDPRAAVIAALASPIGTPPLAELAKKKKSACIVICDITRPVPNALLVGEILATLTGAGILASKIKILIATGTHRPSTNSERVEMLGEAVLATGVVVIDHVCTDASTMRSLGISPNGVLVSLNTHYLDADVKITVGLIEPHFMAGFSGGRKLIMPGIAALHTVQAWHSPRFLEHEKARNCVLDGNPVHFENLAIARLAPADFICDVTIDEKRRVTGVFAGAMEAAWLAGVAFVERQVKAKITEPVDIAVTSGGGYPLDATFYQIIKGLVGAYPIVKPGGTVILAAALTEGIGSAHFQKTLETTPDLKILVQEMTEPDWEPIPDQWQVEMLAKVLRNHNVTVVSDGLPLETLRQLHVAAAPTVEAALADALKRHGKHATIAVIPKGPYVVPEVIPS